MKKIAILISDTGTGSNLQAIIDGIKDKKIQTVISVVISDTPHALGLQKAEKNHIPVHIMNMKDNLILVLKKNHIDYICLAGWKKIIPKEIISMFKNRILNIHPGLIPDTLHSIVENPDGTNGLWNRGKMTEKAIQNFLDQKATYAGSSVHFLTYQFDFGPVLERYFEKIKPNDTVDSLYERLKRKEHEIYVKALMKVTSD